MSEPSKEAVEEMKGFILEQRAKGHIVVLGLEGPMMMPLEEFVKQPADGMLYDLNRLEEVALTLTDGKKWVNDFAVALVIRKLVEQRDAALAARPEGVATETEMKLLQLWCEYSGGHLGGSEYKDMVSSVIAEEILPKRSRPQRQPEQCTYPKCGCVGSCQYQRTAAVERE